MTTNAVVNGADPSIGKSFRKGTLAALALALASALAAPTHGHAQDRAVIDRDAFLNAVAEVETGGNARAIGRQGERGLYQFTRATWRRYSSRAFADAHNPAIARDVAVQHFVWLHDRILAAGLEPTPNRLAIAWNAGVGRAVSGVAPRSTREYARRVSNLARVHRPSGGKPPVAPVAPVALAAAAPARVVPPAPVEISFNLEEAPDAIPVGFSLDRAVPEVADTSSSEITFTLASPAQPDTGTGATTSSSAPRRLFFATIGE